MTLINPTPILKAELRNVTPDLHLNFQRLTDVSGRIDSPLATYIPSLNNFILARLLFNVQELHIKL